MSALRTLVLLGLIGTVVPSVATDEPMAGSAETAVPAIDATAWRILAYRSDAEADTDLVSIEPRDVPPRLAFAEGRVSGTVGCNSFSGGYTLEGDHLTIDPRMAMTMMACEESLMALEQAITTHLAAVAGYRQAERTLELLDAGGAVLILLETLTETPLVGDTWRLETYNNGKQALVSTVKGTEITLALTPDGTLSGSDGCNRYMSGYTLEEGRLMIGPIATTRMACRGPQAVAEQAAAYAAALGMVRGYRIEGEQLWLTTEDGATAARFRVVPETAKATETR
ncbi:META domain-containing protein [Thiocapsa bogorovii]|uniref:META domain-containing protein n=1 Tax=Thiocapsa bogorovii TaxID=521689 RepID=UPI001E4CA1AE|nr:META domain-containing protein [Thiocapsa bogorovii]UHD14310.1 META domain-containing protein [Thiocapsa bogorovii]